MRKHGSGSGNWDNIWVNNQSTKLRPFSCKIKQTLTVKLMSFGNFFFEKIPKTGEQSITYSKEIDYFTQILNFVNVN